MKRIESAGCGYSYSAQGLRCTSIKPLHPYFANTSISFIDIPVTSPRWVEFDGSTYTQPTLDNYGQVPQTFEGFIMTLSPVIDMSGGTTYPEVPEIECRVNMDPFTGGELAVLNNDPAYTYNEVTGYTGFIDLFTNVTAYNSVVYADVNGATTALSNKIPVMVDSSTAQTPYMVKPGILEPMLETQLPDIDVKTIPAVDAGLDGAFLALDRLQQWRSVIDTRITNLTYAIDEPEIFPQDSPCENFKIVWQLGADQAEPYQPDVISGGTHSTIKYPVYSIGDGRLVINGATVAVTGATTAFLGTDAYEEVVIDGSIVKCARAPFAAYLKVSSGTDGIAAKKIVYRMVSPAPTIDASLYYIGGVTEVFDPASAGASKGTALFQIDQGDCIEDIEYITGESTGYVYMNVTAGGRQYTTDPLLTSMENLTAATESRGVQAKAIAAYVASHGGGGGGAAEYDGPFKVSYENNVISVYDGKNAVAGVAGYAIVGGTSRYSVSSFVGAPSNIDSALYIVAYKQEPTSSAAGSPLQYIYVNGSKYDRTDETVTVNGITYMKWVIGPDGVYTVGEPVAGSAAYHYDTDHNTMTVTGYVAAPEKPVGFFYQFGDSQSISQPNFWYTRLASFTQSGGTYNVQQIHYGDLNVVSGGTSTVVDSLYSGPFGVSVDSDNVYHISCPSCGANDDDEPILGWYSIDGQYETAVTGVYSGSADGATAVYFHKTATTTSINTTPGNTTDPTEYTVRLARISGGTAYQLHFGNIFIDGRWGTPEPAPPYTVSSASGTGEGSIFGALSAQNRDLEIHIDPALNGQPIDFEGASVL